MVVQMDTEHAPWLKSSAHPPVTDPNYNIRPQPKFIAQLFWAAQLG